MNVYIDLSLLSLIICNLVTLYIINLLTIKKIKIITVLLLSIISAFKILLIYHPIIPNIIINILYILVFYLFNREKYILNTFLYIFFSNVIPVFMLLFFDGIKLINTIVIIHKPIGCIILIAYIFIAIIFYIVTKIVDSLFRLHSFKDTVFLEIDNRKFKVSAYFDSGNYAKYGDIPVIFLKSKSYPFNLSIFKNNIEINSLNGKKVFQGTSALLTIIDKKESYFVYVCLDDIEGSYHGCDLLLNAYLI